LQTLELDVSVGFRKTSE